MSLYDAPHSLVYNQFVSVRAQAINVIGSGAFGENSAAVANTLLRGVPRTMYSPMRGEATTVNQIELNWQALTGVDTGNSPVTSYNLVWDAGLGDCTLNLVGFSIPYTGLSYVVTQGLSPDTTYCFKLRAKNQYGWGEYSIVSYIRTSDNPGQMEIVITESIIDPIDQLSKVRIYFEEPEANGEYISKYQILIQKKDGSFAEELTHCDGMDS